jgi:hypothetical protein
MGQATFRTGHRLLGRVPYLARRLQIVQRQKDEQGQLDKAARGKRAAEFLSHARVSQFLFIFLLVPMARSLMFCTYDFFKPSWMYSQLLLAQLLL